MELGWEILFTLVKIVLVLGFLFSLTSLLTWMERRQSAMIQDRIGPTRANLFGITLFGLLHPVADGIKMLTKEDVRPAGANGALHTLAPMLALFPVLVTFAVIPFGPTVRIGGHTVPLQIARLDVGILYIFALASLGVYGVVIAGWASNNKWSLLGAVRASAQMISYEVSMGLSIMGILVVYQTLRLDELVAAQGTSLWGVVVQPVGFILFLTAAIAETKRTPFDMPECESEIVAGYFTEYSGMKFGMFYLAEFMEIVVAAAVITTLFFGGWQVPFLAPDGFHLPGGSFVALSSLAVTTLQILAFVGKVFFFCWLQLMIRWTIPRFRYDQIMRLGWKVMLPLSLANLFVTALVVLLLDQARA